MEVVRRKEDPGRRFIYYRGWLVCHKKIFELVLFLFLSVLSIPASANGDPSILYYFSGALIFQVILFFYIFRKKFSSIFNVIIMLVYFLSAVITWIISLDSKFSSNFVLALFMVVFPTLITKILSKIVDNKNGVKY